MTAAQQVDANRLTIMQQEDVVREGGRKQRKMSSELAIEKRTLSLLFSSLTVVRQAASTHFASNSPDDHPAAAFCARVSTLLTDTFKATVKIYIYGTDGNDGEKAGLGRKSNVDSSSRRDIKIISDLLINEQGAVIGTISVSTEALTATRAGGATGVGDSMHSKSSSKYVKDVKSYSMKDLEEPSKAHSDGDFIIGNTDRSLGSEGADYHPQGISTGESSQKRLDFLTATAVSQSPVDLDIVAVVLKPIAVTLSGVLSCLSRERDAQGRSYTQHSSFPSRHHLN